MASKDLFWIWIKSPRLIYISELGGNHVYAPSIVKTMEFQDSIHGSAGKPSPSSSIILETESHDEETIKVVLRLRPKNKLETMKRAKDCIHFHDNPQNITVESPLLGEFEFGFDQVSERVRTYLKTTPF